MLFAATIVVCLLGPGLELGHEVVQESVRGVVEPETGATECLYTQTLGRRSNTCKMNRNPFYFKIFTRLESL